MTNKIQAALLERIKYKVDSRISYVDELAELLNLSKDSVYRRIRGETELSLSEAVTLCEKFQIPFHELMDGESSLYSFQGRLVSRDNLPIYNWLELILQNLKLLDSYPGQKQLIYYTKDLPVFYYYNYPKLTAFKMYFWMRTIHNYPEFESARFTFNAVPQEMIALGQRIWNKFCQIPSTEIWAQETTVVTLRQIEYYHDCGYFENPSDALLIIDEFEQLLRDSKDWMKKGEKPGGASLQIYRNDVLLGDNTILFELGDQRMVFLPIGNLSLLSTSNATFCAHIEGFLNTVIKRAVLISATGEKERNRYFNLNDRLIQELRARLS